MDVEFKRDETVLRWLTVKLDKYAVEYAVRRRNKLSETKKSRIMAKKNRNKISVTCRYR